jgi:hypothetical protein
VTYEYPEFILTYSSRFLNHRSAQGRIYGIEFWNGRTLFIDRAGYEIYPETRKIDQSPSALSEKLKTTKPPGSLGKRTIRTSGTHSARSGEGSEHIYHVRNFLDCVKSRQRPVSDVEEGHRSTTAAHLGNISLHTGRKIRWDAEKEVVINDPEANKLLTREYRKPWEV